MARRIGKTIVWSPPMVAVTTPRQQGLVVGVDAIDRIAEVVRVGGDIAEVVDAQAVERRRTSRHVVRAQQDRLAANAAWSESGARPIGRADVEVHTEHAGVEQARCSGPWQAHEGGDSAEPGHVVPTERLRKVGHRHDRTVSRRPYGSLTPAGVSTSLVGCSTSCQANGTGGQNLEQRCSERIPHLGNGTERDGPFGSPGWADTLSPHMAPAKIRLACPACRLPLRTLGDAGTTCESCGGMYPVVDGIHRFLTADRLAFFQPFLRDYTAVRLGEGRGAIDGAALRRLPEPTTGDPLERQWNLRRRTWATVRDRVLRSSGSRLVVIDIGAGVGWLSNRLGELGHQPHAVDLTIDDVDGLGAARHYDPPWPRYQAEMDALPFADGQADMVVFNASLHYSTDYVRTIGEALRVLRPGGRVVIMDSPVYRHDQAGLQMVAERHADFETRFGTRSDSVASIEYLTDAMLADVGRRLGVTWRRHRTWYGWSWAARPWKARLRRRRQPSRFVVLVGTRDVLR
jgi:SAM-dependent methyltransferase